MNVDEWDAARIHPAVDHATLAAQLDVDVDEHERTARVHEVLLAGRASGGGQGTDLSPEHLRAAELGAVDIAAYMRVTDRLLRS